jgi:hypothetical protein
MGQMTVDSTSKLLVVSIDDMDSGTFRVHMNHRHQESLGYAGKLPRFFFADNTEYIERCYRAFHRTLHRLRFDLGHEHQELVYLPV